MTDPGVEALPGRTILRVSDVVTVVFSLVAIASAVFLEELKGLVVVVSLLLFLVPVGGLLLAVTVLGERPSPLELVGVSVTISGIGVALRGSERAGGSWSPRRR